MLMKHEYSFKSVTSFKLLLPVIWLQIFECLFKLHLRMCQRFLNKVINIFLVISKGTLQPIAHVFVWVLIFIDLLRTHCFSTTMHIVCVAERAHCRLRMIGRHTSILFLIRSWHILSAILFGNLVIEVRITSPGAACICGGRLRPCILLCRASIIILNYCLRILSVTQRSWRLLFYRVWVLMLV